MKLELTRVQVEQHSEKANRESLWYKALLDWLAMDTALAEKDKRIAEFVALLVEYDAKFRESEL